ncbi:MULTISPECIES: 50S ribosomal protein L30 [Solimonas]|uniref:50S ribosomal protein L30 n=1 Tax=Solimonas TaxID=413435 RepID=UPI000362C600|nr:MULTISPECIES: 50S ribosomal protein L30 [Solimonas]
MTATKQIKLTLIRSLAKRLPNHQACVHGLGLRRMHQTVTIAATPENMGMVNKVAYMLRVEEV